MIDVKLIKKSKSKETGTEITTLELKYPRYIHSEFMTHRVFSRNAQSSRAIPISKMIENLEEEYVIPYFMKNKKGMSADEKLSYSDETIAKNTWLSAMDIAIYHAGILDDLGVHKQIVNRLLEPFSFIKVIVTATDWDNFFNLRSSSDAQQEIQELSNMMKDAIYESKADELNNYEYHLPYITNDEIEKHIYTASGSYSKKINLIKASVARCARVSYLNHDSSNPDIEKDISLHDTLLLSRHMSPFEHVATPTKGRWANFKNWCSYRTTLEIDKNMTEISKK